MLASLTIARRFRGPRTSANGGYAAGCSRRPPRAGVDAGTGVEVTLRLPPPLERPLAVTRDGERVLLLDGEALVAEARPGDPGRPAAAADVRGGAGGRPRSGGLGAPGFDECFVCGTRPRGRRARDPCRPRPGREDGLVATTWVRTMSVPRSCGRRSTAPAHTPSGRGRGEPLLARMTARIDRLPAEGERCVVVGWPLDATDAGAMPQPRSTARRRRRWRSRGSSGSSRGGRLQDRAADGDRSIACRISAEASVPPAAGLARCSRSLRAGVVHGVSATSSPPSSS